MKESMPRADSSIASCFFAHSANERGVWHRLDNHLARTAEIAKSFGRTQLEQDLFHYAAILHDAGKYQAQFQKYIREGGRRGSVPHAVHGAALGYSRARQNAVSMAVLGHHQGLLDLAKCQSSISNALKVEVLRAMEEDLISENPEIPELERRLTRDHKYQKKEDFTAEFFVRYLFSALTDADWLDTESHFLPDKAMLRSRQVLAVDELVASLEAHFSRMKRDGVLNQLRNKIRDEVVSNAPRPVGSFSLNVPTGLGKTLTSIYWALKHAKANDLKRIIIVLPFVNIIDQTCQVLSGIFGEGVILEHHSGVLEDERNNEEDVYNTKVLATENWDYPIIVSTTVQFFESLFSNKPSKCRKIHNIADSVVIFDEVQALRQDLVLPTLEMLRQVQEVMHTSFLFCTATQPAFEAREGFAGLERIHPLVNNPRALFEKTKRVDYSIIDDFNPLSLEQLVSTVIQNGTAVLIVVNTKKDARKIFEALKIESNFESIHHLSTNMCPLHRKSVIASIREALGLSKKICVVSTQLIEAGVDFDFPVVYRALAPLESIIQAAGRCNREGRLAERGRVYLFTLENGGMPPGLYSTCADYTKLLIRDNIGFLDRHDSFSEYYRQVQSLFVCGDKRQINDSRRSLLFEQVAESYHLIDKDTVPLFVRAYAKGIDLINRLKGKPFLNRSDMRSLQPYLVNFYRQAMFSYAPFVDHVSLSGVLAWEGKYDLELGVVTDGYSAEELIV